MAVSRTVLILLPVFAVTGCLGGPGGALPWSTEDGQLHHEAVVFDHAGAESPAIEGGLRYPSDTGDPPAFYLALVTTEEAAERFEQEVLPDDADGFVDETDFGRAYLVVFEAFPASSVPDYRVERVEWREGELHLAVADSSDGGTDDVTVETLLVRVDRGERGLPDVVAVTTEEGDSISIEIGRSGID